MEAKPRITCPAKLWRECLAELHNRGEGRRESGAFLLGHEDDAGRRSVARVVYYDDLDPHCLETGIVIFDGAGYGPLWQLCREAGLGVIADVHTHPLGAFQSRPDRENPMVPLPGHIALIVPYFARPPVLLEDLGIYEYLGEYCWREHGGPRAAAFFRIEDEDEHP